MRIKKFNEHSIKDFQQENEGLLAQFIHEHNFSISTYKNELINNSYDVSIMSWNDVVRWEDCKDDIIPYFEYINRRYKIDNEITFSYLADCKEHKLHRKIKDLESLLNNNFLFFEITFSIYF